MIVTPVDWMILKGNVRVSIASGMPCGRQRSVGAPTPSPFWRSSCSVFAQGRNGAPPGRSDAMSYTYLDRIRPSVGITRSPTTSHTPDRSGLPFACRGTGAVRLGVPSGSRGVFGSFWLSHCAFVAVTRNATTTRALASGRALIAGDLEDRPDSAGNSDAECRYRRYRIR